MMSRFMDDARERRRHEHVARELRITTEILDNYPYEVDADERGMIWRVLWTGTAPPAVTTNGAKGSLWSEIHPHHEREL
jgi:hypothetical protein